MLAFDQRETKVQNVSAIASPFAIIHVPHSSKKIPYDEFDQFILRRQGLEQEILSMTDLYVGDLFKIPETVAKTVLFPISRLVVDPERFEDDFREEMSAKGMGVIYIKTAAGLPLRREISPSEREDLLRKYYRPHHEQLAKAVGEALSRYQKCLIIDAHSYPSRPLPYEIDQRPDRPEICLGTDEYHTPELLKDLALEMFGAEFKNIEINRPFKGTIGPAKYLRRDPRIQSIMIEINRSLYMKENTGAKASNYNKVKRMIR